MKSRIIARWLSLILMFEIAALNLLADDQPAPPLSDKNTPVHNSRFIFMPPMDDNGKTSGFHAITICLPPGYDSTDRRYPVLYLMDGESCFFTRQNGPSDTIAYEMVHDQLVHDGLIEPAILVAVHNGSDASGKILPTNRLMDYYPDMPAKLKLKSHAAGYFEFLSQKLKPMIDRTYRTRPDPASTGIVGFSAGAIAAFWMTYQHPEVFGMGLCQSPGRGLEKEILDQHQGPIPHVRLWLDAGSREIGDEGGLMKDAYDATQTLIARGFVQNDNIAFQIGHDQGHEKFDCTQRLRSALYFLLRVKKPVFTGADIVEIDSKTKGPILLGRLGRAVLETEYDGWFRITDCTATLKVADPTVVRLGNIMNNLEPLSPGETTVSTSFDGREITQKVTVPPPMPPFACPPVKGPVTVDGDLSKWPELPYVVDAPRQNDNVEGWKGPSDLSYRFGCAHDDKFLYIAVQTRDDIIKSDPKMAPWFQDGVEVRIDARPTPERLFIRGKDEFKDILLVAMSPAKAGETRLPYNSTQLPEGTQAVCKVTPTGYNTEIAIPFTYLDAKAGKPWQDVRINIVVDDLDNQYKGFRGNKFWWQADWKSADNMWGSGTFERQ